MVNNVKIIKKGRDEIKNQLSLLWIFVTVNYIFCDVLSVMDPEYLKTATTGSDLSGLQMTQGFLLGAAIMMEIPFIMIIISMLMNYRISRMANLIAGALMILIQISSFFAGTAPTLHYIFFSVVEIVGDLIIFGIAFRWKE